MLQAITLDPSVEEEVAESLMHTPDGELLALDPARAGSIVGRAVRARRRTRRARGRHAGARLLEPRAPPPAAPDRAVAAAAAGARLHRDRARHPRREPSGPWWRHESLDEPTTFRGATLDEVLPQIRAELGPEAIILAEREGVVGGIGGFFARKCVEVEAVSRGARRRSSFRSRPIRAPVRRGPARERARARGDERLRAPRSGRSRRSPRPRPR